MRVVAFGHVDTHMHRDWNMRVENALAAAQRLPEGLARAAALKAAALLREAANMFEALKPTKR